MILLRLKALSVLAVILTQMFSFSACKPSSPVPLPENVTAWVAYQLPFVPLKFVLDSNGNLTIKGEASIPTPIGNFSFGAGYTPDLTPKRQWREAALPAPMGDIDIVLIDRSRNEGQIYSISTNDAFVAIINGEAALRIKDRQIFIEVSKGFAKTNIADGRFQSLGILPAPVLGEFSLDKPVVKRYPGSFSQKISNCGSDSVTSVAFPASSNEPFSVSAKGDVEWEIEGAQSQGIGTYFNGGALPIETDLSEKLSEYRKEPSESSRTKSIRWEVPTEANAELECLFKWWEVWSEGYIDVFLLDRRVARIRVRYFIDIDYSYEIAGKHTCLSTAVALPPSTPSPPRPEPASLFGLINAAQDGKRGDVDSWLNRGADVNGRIANGRTALMAAAANGHSDATRLLLERGADINAKDNSGRTAIMDATASGHDDTVKVLLQWRPDVSAVDHSGMTALKEARRRQSKTLVDMLLRAGAWQ